MRLCILRKKAHSILHEDQDPIFPSIVASHQKQIKRGSLPPTPLLCNAHLSVMMFQQARSKGGMEKVVAGGKTNNVANLVEMYRYTCMEVLTEKGVR